MKPYVEKILLTDDEIRARVKEMGNQLTKDYEGKDLVIIGVLKGSVVFYADLVREIDSEPVFDFIAVSSYGAGTKSSGVVRFLKDTDISIENKHVLIVEDIVDTGLTLAYLCNNFKTRRPRFVENLLSSGQAKPQEERYSSGLHRFCYPG